MALTAATKLPVRQTNLRVSGGNCWQVIQDFTPILRMALRGHDNKSALNRANTHPECSTWALRSSDQ